MVWGPVEGFAVWPGLVQKLTRQENGDTMCKVSWFGDGMISKVRIRTCCVMASVLDLK